MTHLAVTTRSIRDPETGELRDSLSRDWTQYLDRQGFTVNPLTNAVRDPAGWVRDVSPDALLLTNGEDVGSHEPRDRTERLALEFALEAGLPVLGVCRGHQFVNSHYGGTLEGIGELISDGQAHAGTVHDVELSDVTFGDVLPDRFTVNSFHDVGVSTEGVAPELLPFATATDGVVEGLYHPEHRLLTIQWHPERTLSAREPTDTLVNGFLGGDITW